MLFYHVLFLKIGKTCCFCLLLFFWVEHFISRRIFQTPFFLFARCLFFIQKWLSPHFISRKLSLRRPSLMFDAWSFRIVRHILYSVTDSATPVWHFHCESSLQTYIKYGVFHAEIIRNNILYTKQQQKRTVFLSHKIRFLNIYIYRKQDSRKRARKIARTFLSLILQNGAVPLAGIIHVVISGFSNYAFVCSPVAYAGYHLFANPRGDRIPVAQLSTDCTNSRK